MGVLVHGEDHFSHSQHSLVVWSSSCSVEAPWSFPSASEESKEGQRGRFGGKKGSGDDLIIL